MSDKGVRESVSKEPDRRAATLSSWLVLALLVSTLCMLVAACVAGYAFFHSPRIPALADEPAQVQLQVAEDPEDARLREIDAGLEESSRLLKDIRKKEDELRAQVLLAQMQPMVRVAAVQFASEFGKVADNREPLSTLIRKAAGNGARIVVMPECALPGYMSIDHQTAWRDPVRRTNPKDGRSIVEAAVADTVPGENTRHFGALAKELNIYLVITLIEKVERAGEGGAVASIDYYNTAVLLAPDGNPVCHYRKLNLWPPGDATWAQAGDLGLGLCDTPFGKLGLLICYDLSSGVVDKLKAAGATMILYPVGWVHPKPPEDWFERMLPEKVKEWGVPLVAANWSVSELPKAGDACGYGYSSIYAADGRVLSGAGPDGTEVIYADVPVPAPDIHP